VSETLQAAITLGWREWLALPALGVARIKAKVDTGARSSALHVAGLARLPGQRLRFSVVPQRHLPRACWCEAEQVDERWVTDAGGHRELRPFIRTLVQLHGDSWPIELSLTSRDSMRYRMLLGRSALGPQHRIDPTASFLTGRGRNALLQRSGG